MRRLVFVLLAVLVVPAVTAADPKPEPDLTARLHRYYATRAGYTKVHRDVMGWHKTTLNGCVAFASTALRHVGIDVPLKAKKDGFGVSRITGAFARYLAEDLGWTRIEDPDKLRPGDIVFTTDAPCCPGYPAHVMVFDGWARSDHKVGRFLDNQGFRVARSMKHTPGSQVDGFGYALRPTTL
jgi:hypothetical protein